MRRHRYLLVYAVVTSQTYCGDVLTDVPTSLNGEMVPRNSWVSESTSFICLLLTETHAAAARFEHESSGMRSGKITSCATTLTYAFSNLVVVPEENRSPSGLHRHSIDGSCSQMNPIVSL